MLSVHHVPPIAQLVERRTVEVVISVDILRSLVRIRLGGLFFPFLQEISEVHETSAQEGDTAVSFQKR